MSEAALTVAKAESFQVPAIVAEVGPEATKKFFEFFTVPIRNKNTRLAYYHAVGQFLAWCGRAAFRAWKISSRSRSQLTSSSTRAPRRRSNSIWPIDAARMLKRRLAQAGITGSYSPHSFRASGLTRFLEEGGTLEGAQNIADHADSRTTKALRSTAANRPQGERGADSLLKMFRVSSLASMADQADRKGTPYEVRRYSRWRFRRTELCA